MDIKVPSIKLLFGITVLILSSWFLVHLLAIFGIFLVVAYPIWWLFAPQYAICFLCRSQKDGTFCPFCRQKVIKSEGIFPKNIRSILLNSVVILLFTITSLGLVYGESKLLQLSGFLAPQKTVSFIIPPKGQYKLGEIFPVKIQITGIKTSINTVQADISFDPAKVELIDFTTEDSFATVFIQKEINNTAGYARITGGIPSPGFSGKTGMFAKAFFKGKVPGIININFLPSSLVLANDGKGTNVIKDLPTFSYLILPQKVSPVEQEIQPNVYYNKSVLGISSDTPKILLYDENASDSVLGASTQSDIGKKKVSAPSSFHFFDVLGNIDSFILDSWTRLLPFKH